MKLIRIRYCYDCPYYQAGYNGEKDACFAIDETGTSRNAIITDPSKIKDNCPLEDECLQAEKEAKR